MRDLEIDIVRRDLVRALQEGMLVPGVQHQGPGDAEEEEDAAPAVQHVLEELA